MMAVPLTWDLQLVAEGVRLVAAEPGGILLQVAWLLLEAAHFPHQVLHLNPQLLVLPALKQLCPLGPQYLLQLFIVFLKRFNTFLHHLQLMLQNQI